MRILDNLDCERTFAGLDGKGVHLHSHVPTHTILKAYVWYVAFLNYCMVCFPNLLWTHNFFTLLITLFMIALAKCSVHLYSLFIYFLDKVTFDFSCTCYMLNTLKCCLNHSTNKALQVFLLFVYVICSRLFSFYIISLMPIILSSILTEPILEIFPITSCV